MLYLGKFNKVMKAQFWIPTLFLAMALGFVACQPPKPVVQECEPLPDQVGAIRFCKLEYDWGTINSGDSVFAFFTFKNARKFPVRITGVYTSCECTQGEFPKDPIPPGGYGQIVGKFFSAGQPIARFEKILAIQVEGEELPASVMMKGNVVAQ